MSKYIVGGDINLQLNQLLNSGLTLQDNLDGALLEIETTGEEQTVIHGLGRIPSGFILLQIIQDAAFEPIDPNGNMQVNKDKEDWLYFIPSGTSLTQAIIGVDLWSIRVNEWTREILFLQANVKNLKARLFVL